LIEHGHSFAEIKQYTRAQIDLFYGEAKRTESRRLADLIFGVRTAFSGKEVNKVIEELKK
jgi:hypothetical protein